MRFLVPSLCGCGLILGVALAQTAQNSSSSGSGGMRQLPVGQVYKDFIFPFFQNGVKSWTLSAREAVGKTQNRAEATELKIEFFEDDKVTTTITSPLADLFMNDRKMRTKNTVQVYRPTPETSTMTATGQTCDFDMLTKKYVIRGNVKVVLKNVDTDLTPTPSVHPAGVTPAPAPSTNTQPPLPVDPSSAPLTPTTIPEPGSMSDSPGVSPPTNAAPVTPVTP